MAKVEDVTLHTFRHTFATVGAELGYADTIIGKLVGHRPRGSTTSSRYIHLDEQAPILRACADAIAGKIGDMLTLHCDRPATPRPSPS